MKVALVGLGKWGKNILRELVSLRSEVLVVLHTSNPEKEAFLKENYSNVSFTYNKESVLHDNAIENVFIATPMDTHCVVAQEYIEADKNVFLEKPISNRSSEGEKLVHLAEEKGVSFMVGHIFLYHECFLKLKEELLGADILEVNIKKSSRISEGSLLYEVFLDSFIHEMSVALKLFGIPNQHIFYGKIGESIEELLQSKNYKLELNYPNFKFKVEIVPEEGEKIRQFEFKTNTQSFVWRNEELFVIRNGGEEKMHTSTTSPLRRELEIFLNEYPSRGDEIRRNNYIAVEAVRLLEALAK